MFDGQYGMTLDPMQGNLASSQVDLDYTEVFGIAALNSGSL